MSQKQKVAHTRSVTGSGSALGIALLYTLLSTGLAHGQTATITTWDVGANPTIMGLNPHETVEDPDGLTNHVGAPAMVSSMENTGGGFCGLLIWNPNTNTFKSYNVTGGFQFAGDVNRSAPAVSGFGGGDFWMSVNGTASHAPYVNFRGSNNFRRWNVGASSASGVRVNSANGKVYLGNFTPGQLIELDPATNAVKTWATLSSPYNLVVAGSFVYATAVAGGGQPHQILRLNPATNELTRWNIPGAFQTFVTAGTPDSITQDAEGNIWFTESPSNRVARLNPTTNVIDEFTTAGVNNPHAVASSGTGASLQAFFTEATGGAISLITVSAATPTTTTVTPSTATVTPTTSTATPTDFTATPVTATITPATFTSTGTTSGGIARFPIPPGTSMPTGMTRVAFPGTVLGSMEGSSHVFRLVSGAIIAPTPTPGGPPQAAAQVPTLSTWTLLLLGVLLSGIALLLLNRRA